MSSFYFFLSHVIGKSHRAIAVTVCFNSVPTAPQQVRIRKSLPASLRKMHLQVSGQMLTAGVGKILSRVMKEDYGEMRKKYEVSNDFEEAYSFSHYLSSFQGRDQLERDLEDWIMEMHSICPVCYVLRDESDLSEHRYPGAQWLNIATVFHHWHYDSMKNVRTFFDTVAETISKRALEEEERALLSYSIKAIHAAVRHSGIVLPDKLPLFVHEKSVLERYLCENDTYALGNVLNSIRKAGFRDVMLYHDLGDILHEQLGDRQRNPAVRDETWLWLADTLYPLPDAWEIVFDHPYRLSLIFDLSILLRQDRLLKKTERHIRDLDVRTEGYVRWLGYRAEFFLQQKMYDEAFRSFSFLLQFDVHPDFAYADRDMITLFPNALYTITERNSGLIIDESTIDFFLERCLPFREQCPALDAHAALIYIQRKQYDKAAEAYQRLFVSTPPSHIKKQVVIDKSTYCNALWIALKENSGLDLPYETQQLFIAKSLEHAEQNPAIYTNLSLVYAQAGDLETAYLYFCKSREKDSDNHLQLTKEITETDWLKPLQKYIAERHGI